MKKLSLFYTSRFLFQRRGPEPEKGSDAGRRAMPEVEKVRTAAEVREAQKTTVREIYATQRERVRMLQGKKKVEGEKFEQKEARVSNNVMVVKVNGMPGRIDPADQVKVLNGGQVYEMDGVKYVKVDVSGKRGTSKGRTKSEHFTAYVQLDALREPREVEGNKTVEAYRDEVRSYLDNVAKGRFYIDINYSAPEGPVVTVRDTEQSNRVVCWALLDIQKNLAGDYLDTFGDTGSPMFQAREREFGRQSAATLVMGTSGYNPDATYEQDIAVRAGKVPTPDKRVRLAGPDTVHYSLGDAVARAKKEIDYYMQENPSSGFPGPLPGDPDFVDEQS
ncbi:hypothetical protein HY604_04225 [Candidatus Peregrinibacteria bacterium]|nr:hypothetical protein [Candidatus Peregrinibacteria bacterium]